MASPETYIQPNTLQYKIPHEDVAATKCLSPSTHSGSCERFPIHVRKWVRWRDATVNSDPDGRQFKMKSYHSSIRGTTELNQLRGLVFAQRKGRDENGWVSSRLGLFCASQDRRLYMNGQNIPAYACGHLKEHTFGFGSFEDPYAIAILSVVNAHQSRAVRVT